MTDASTANSDGDDVRRILFVDDEQHVLDGLRDALRSYRRRWKMTFVTNGQDALSAVDGEPFDVVVSDLRMPGMDGATLLEHVRERCPTTVRIVLSGHGEVGVFARAAGIAHELLAKPCETDQLARLIERSCAMRRSNARVELNRQAAGAATLPCAPEIYLELTEALADSDGGVK